MINYYNQNFAILTDLYQLTMLQAYFFENINYRTVFDYFFRRQPFNGGYCVFTGLDTLLEVITGIRFTDSDINYLKSTGFFKEEFLSYLKSFKFTGDIYSFEEGEIVFPNEPILRVEAPIIEAQLIETILLNILNYQTLIATKTSRIVNAAKGRGVIEFGLRRSQGPDGGISGSRASYVGGAVATSNVFAGKVFGIPVTGTMAHSFVMAFDSEKDAFLKYAKIYPNNTVLLIDTYDTLKGIKNAIPVLKKLKKMGVKKFGIRLDSGDLSYLSKKIRKELDSSDLKECFIVASNELDEYIIETLLRDEACIDFFGVGTKLITASDDPWLSGVYKLSQIYKYNPIPVIKVSNNIEKTTIPGKKNVIRFYESDTPLCDLILLEEEMKDITEKINSKSSVLMKHPFYHYELNLKHYDYAKLMIKKVISDGNIVCERLGVAHIREKALSNINNLDNVYKRFLNPEIYKVMLSSSLYTLREKMIKKYRG